jgi:hypothetical protein
VGNAVGEVQSLVAEEAEAEWRSCHVGIGNKNGDKEWINTASGGGLVVDDGWSYVWAGVRWT